ncbi:helix-turn-helix domain-containing protein [Prauserella endophytica]|uniref:Helix-turn-helix domain-containing protein n=1 Tax=Prauserella endophytica TaxID=1592324 RepID=A0ABY2RV49_9PSEU|nr:helix-turn-helix domain-containing protein [Prauserella endophytica]
MVTLNPTAIRRWIAIEMQRLRQAADHKPEDAAKRIGKAKTVIHHIETGRNLPAPADLEVLLNLYGVAERVPFFRELVKSAKRGTDWWIGFTSTVPEWFNLYLGLESAAARISSYDSQWIPGLFQTREYAEALYRAGEQRMTDDEVASAVELRMARQEIITRHDDPPQIWCVLDENALRRQVGGPDVMRAQLDRLVKLAELPNVDIQIVPHAIGAHAGAEGTFTILDYPPDFEGDPGTVYVETRQQGIYYERPEQVTDYRRVFERLQVQAEKPEKSPALISKAQTKDTR